MIRRLTVFLLLTVLVAGCSSGPKELPGPQPAAESQSNTSSTTRTISEQPRMTVDATQAMRYLREIVAIGRRAPGSPGHKRIHAYLRDKFKQDDLEEDVFTAQTPKGPFELRNFIVRYPGTEERVIVLASHYETPHWLGPEFVGANDGGSSTALLLAMADRLRAARHTGPAVWLVFFDGEESFEKWSKTDSVYGSRHLAERWKKDGTLRRIQAFILTDMVGDADLGLERDANSTPWLRDLILQAATNLGYQSYFFVRENVIEDDHVPFGEHKVPVVDLIDLDYGYGNVFHHSAEDTLDKVSPKSLQIVGDVIFESIRLLQAR